MTEPYGPAFRVAMPFDRARWPAQIEAACRLIESEFRGNPLDTALVMKGSRCEFRHVEDRARYLAQRVRQRGCTVSLHNHRSCEAAGGQIGPAYLGQMGIGGKNYPYDGPDVYTLMVCMPPGQADESYQRLTRAILDELGDGCRLLG